MVWWKLQSITSIQPSFHDVPIDIHQRKPELPTSVCSRNGSATDHGQTDHGLQPKGLSMVEILKAKQRRWLSWSLYLLSVSHVYSPFFESFFSCAFEPGAWPHLSWHLSLGDPYKQWGMHALFEGTAERNCSTPSERACYIWQYITQCCPHPGAPGGRKGNGN